MIEGTELSEGRGTTRPFEILGAPYIEPSRLIDELKRDSLPGVIFRAMHFQPTFHKYANRLCGGIQLHVTDRRIFNPVITGVSIISAIFLKAAMPCSNSCDPRSIFCSWTRISAYSSSVVMYSLSSVSDR